MFSDFMSDFMKMPAKNLRTRYILINCQFKKTIYFASLIHSTSVCPPIRNKK